MTIFGKLRVKCRSKQGRGSVDPAAIEEAVKDSWNELSEAIHGLDNETKD